MCDSDDDCPAGTRCGANGLCEPIPCDPDNDECPPGTMCDPDSEVCVPTGECETSADCGDDRRQACVNNQCVCSCDCDGDGNVFVDELTLAVRILGEEITTASCQAADVDGDDAVFVDEVTLCALNLGGCPDR
jgi:hypothetical protein